MRALWNMVVWKRLHQTSSGDSKTVKDLKLRQRWPAIALAIVTIILGIAMYTLNLQGPLLGAFLVPLLFAAIFLLTNEKGELNASQE